MADRDPQTGQFTKTMEDQYADAIIARQDAAAAQEQAPDAEEPTVAQPVGTPAPKALSLEEYGEHLVEVKVDGQTKLVPLKKVRDGLMFQDAYTARRQQDTEWEAKLIAREAEVQRREQEFGLREQAAGRPQAGFGNVPWSGQPSVPTELGAWNMGTAPRPSLIEQPNAGITARQPASVFDNAPEADELRQALGPIQQEVAMLRQTYTDLQREIAQQKWEQRQNERIAALAKKYPGFDREAVEVDILSLSPQEYNELKENMTPAKLYDYMWLRRQASARPPVPEPATPPLVESPSRPVAGTPPKLAPLMGNNDTEAVAWYEAQLKAKEKPTRGRR